MKYKMIVSDLDDTILASDLTYDPKLGASVAKYTSAGGMFVIATGRMTSATLPYCKELGLRGDLITYQGARISEVSTGQILLERPMQNELLHNVLKYLHYNNIYHQLYLDEKIFVKEITDMSRMYLKFISAQFIELGVPLYDYVLKSNISALKVAIIADPKEVKPYINFLKTRFDNQLIINTSKPWIVEIISNEAGKGSAVKYLADRHSLSPHEIICIGDSANDVSMIEYAGIGVAVANASLEAFRAANIICPPSCADGVRSIIEKFGFLD
ncbi:MAG: Cof-type HAD-IIB family hydrolase [Christensenellaceae bacterium]|jgi:Cof subfamily protein (haloacid dehalogenase superfamily)|nr:Cof-type HAD-IIB family hydrolase [Christensenellaceae bacterium]